MEDVYAWALNLACLGHADELLPHLGDMSAEEAYRMTAPQWVGRGLSPQAAEKLVARVAVVDLRAQVQLARQHQVRLLGWRHAEFPNRLLDIAHPPLALSVRGRLPRDDRAVAIVGARRATAYGRDAATWFGRDLARCGWTVISGMAAGIDAAAHEGALEGRGQTVAVLGCGLDRCYPSGHVELRDRIVSNGCVVSQYALGSRPYPSNFPFRNRLISGLAEAVLVVEGGMSSGSLHTVDWALAQGREVMAVPGSVFAENSQLPHFLIRSGATPAFSPQEVNAHLGGPVLVEAQRSSQPLTGDETQVLACLDSPQTPQEVSGRIGLPIGTVLTRLLSLEIKGWLERRSGNRYTKLV